MKEIDPEWVFHLAAYGSYSSQKDIQTIVATNYNGTVNLVEACLKTGFEAFVNAGSSSEYGHKDHAPSECELTEPNSHYAATKAAATLYCRFIAQREERRTLDAAPLFGVRSMGRANTADADPRRSTACAGSCPRLSPPRSPATMSTWTMPSTHSFWPHRHPPRNPARYSTLAQVSKRPLHQLVDLIREKLKISAEPEWGSMPDRDWDTDVWVSDSTTIRATIGWKPSHGARSGLAGIHQLDYLESDIQRHTRLSNSTSVSKRRGGCPTWKTGYRARPGDSSDHFGAIQARTVGHIGSALSIADLVGAVFDVIGTDPEDRIGIDSCCRRGTRLWRCTRHWSRLGRCPRRIWEPFAATTACWESTPSIF